MSIYSSSSFYSPSSPHSVSRPRPSLPSGHLPPGRSKCPTTPLFPMLCLFLEFPVSVLHNPVHELLYMLLSFLFYYFFHFFHVCSSALLSMPSFILPSTLHL